MFSSTLSAGLVPEAKKPKLEPDSASSGPEICGYGSKCYRKNPKHFQDFRHPSLEALFIKVVDAQDEVSNYHEYSESAVFSSKDDLLAQLKILQELDKDKKTRTRASTSNGSTIETIEIETNDVQHDNDQDTNSMLSKWNNSLPYNFFLTKLPTETDERNVVSFRELFDPSLGRVKAVCHFNFMVEFEWFLDESLSAGLEGKEITIIYGVQTQELVNASSAFPWIKTYFIKSPFPFGHHHTKLSLIKYEDDSLRFVVSTANLIESDWKNRTQGLWIGPKCPVISGAGSGESPTGFRADLIQYLSTYPPKHVAPWITAIQNSNCSHIKVAFVGSAPVTLATSSNGFQWGHKKMEKLLKSCSNQHINHDWKLIFQCSSIGSLGANEEWFRDEIAANMCVPAAAGISMNNAKIPLHVIYPTHENVLNSFDGINSGGCLPYSCSTHMKQAWFQNYLYKWKSDLLGRSRAVPHIKSYCRISPDNTKLAWFLLTSANLSKAAWGKLNKARSKLSVMSWEAGVLFIPKYFGTCETFEVAKSKDLAGHPSDKPLPFYLPYDVPDVKYPSGERPWFIESLLAQREQDDSD